MVNYSLISIGIVLLFIGILLIFIGSFSGSKTKVEAAGGIFIGPFPIFGAFTNKNMFYLLLAFAIIFFILWLIFLKR